MDVQILETAGKAAGIGGVAIGAMILLFRETLRKAVLPKLTREQGYRVITLSLVLVWSGALAGIGAWVWGERGGSSESISTSGDNSPVVKGVGGDVTITNQGK